MWKDVWVVAAAALLASSSLEGRSPSNLLQNPGAESGTDHWRVSGDGSVEDWGINRCFVVRNKGTLHQDVSLPQGSAGKYALLIGRASTERVEPDGVITGLPYLYGMMLPAEKGRILEYLQGQQMRAQPSAPGEWVKVWGIFRIPEKAVRLSFFLQQGERRGVPQNGSAARFDDLGLFVFASEDEARAFADTYGQPPPSAHATRGPQKKAVPSAATCRETATVREEPSKDTSPTNRFGAGPWYVNADRTIWAHAAHARYWMPGSYGNKVLWIRPKGTQLDVAGRRLDGEAPPLRASIPCCYSKGFQVTRVYFPTAG
jgi:hypothetical protein